MAGSSPAMTWVIEFTMSHARPTGPRYARPEDQLLCRASTIKSGSLPGNPDNLVAIGVAKISEISAIWALAGRILDRRAAIRNAGFVPRFGLRRILHDKADCAAIGVAGRLAIDGFADHETAAIVRVRQAASRVLCTRLSTHCGKEGIVEFL